jgi:hypothetical protein
MQMKSDVIVHGVKESEGNFEGRDFSSTTFHCEVDLKENGAGAAIGKATRPFKLPSAGEFKKWEHLGQSLPVKAEAVFEMKAAAGDKAEMVLVAIRPIETRAPGSPAAPAVKQ